MRTKSARVLLALVATLLIYLICFSLFSCSEPHALPTCDWIEAKYDGAKLRIKVESASPFITVCRDYETRVQCANYTKEYFNCISLSADYGEIITFTDKGIECAVEVR